MPSWDAAPVATGLDELVVDEAAAESDEPELALVVGLREDGMVMEPVGWTMEELPNG